MSLLLAGRGRRVIRDTPDMTDSCNPEYERDGAISTSDDDSVSLLCHLNPCQSKGVDEAMEISDLDSQVGNKLRKKKIQMERHPLKAPESAVHSHTQSAEGCASSTSSAANILKCVKITSKTQLNKRNGKGETPLHKACRRGHLAQVKALIQAGSSVNMEDNAGWTALHEASAQGEVAVVEELLRAGANVHARSYDGVTPLHDAVFSQHYQVVKLLLQHGSNANDRSLDGFTALDMAAEGNIKELLLTFQASSVRHEQPREVLAQCRPAGDTPSETHQHMQLASQSSLGPSHNDTAYAQSRESGDGDRAREPGDIQPRKKDTITDNQSLSEAVTVALDEVWRTQTEMLAWPLESLGNADRYRAALTHVQEVLKEVLVKQQMEKDHLAQKCRNVPICLLQSKLESQLISLSLRQNTLVEVLQKQKLLVEMYVTTKAKLFTQPPNRSCTSVMRQQPDHFSPPASKAASSKASEAHSGNQDTQREDHHRPMICANLLPPNTHFAMSKPPVPLPARVKRTPTRAHAMNKNASSSQSAATQPRNTPRHINFQMKRNNALIQTRAEDSIRHLPKLIQRGVLPSGSTLQLTLKGHCHLAYVLGDGSIKDSKGKLHLAPEYWLESILGNNIPVSSAYAWDKVTFRDKPLSYYLLNMEVEGNAAQAHPEDDVQHCRAGSSLEALTPELSSLDRLMKIKIIHVVTDEELVPNALMDIYWETLLNSDDLECLGSEALEFSLPTFCP